MRRQSRSRNARRHRRLCGCIEPLERRLFLSTVTWSATTSGNWSTAADWSTGKVPDSTDDVIINQPGNIKITLSAATSANSLQVTGDTLEVSAGTLTLASNSAINTGATLLVDGGNIALTGNLTNTGTVTVNPGSNLAVSGSITQSGTLTLPNATASTGVGQNLFQNADFESPSIGTSTTTVPDDWGNWSSSFADNQYAYTGAQSLVESGPNSGMNQTFFITPGVTYTLSVYGMTPSTDKLSGAEGAYLNIIYHDSSGNYLTGSAVSNPLDANSAAGGPLTGSVGGQGWNLFTLTAKAPPTAASVTVAIQAGAYTNLPGTSGGSVYWDDAKFGPQAYTTATLTGASLTNTGSLSIGAGAAVNLTGAFSQTATGTLSTQLGGPAASLDYGSLTSAGPATLAGTFTATLTNSYTPSINDGFNILSYSGETGSFSTINLPAASAYTFKSALGPFDFGISAIPPSVSTTVNATANIAPSPVGVVGTNLTYWDYQLTTAQTQQLVAASGMNMFRFPGGSASDNFHFNIAANWGDNRANTITQFAQFIESVGGTGLVTVDYGSGSPQEAEAELAYLDGSPTDTTPIGTGIEWNDDAAQWQNVNWQTVGYWASLRAASPLQTDDGYNFLRIDHPAKFTGITDWEIGNEEYGSWEIDHHGTAGPNNVSTGAQHDPTTYAQFAKSFVSFVAADQSNLPIIHVGIDSGDPTGASDNYWTQNVLTAGAAIGFVPGFISDHVYTQNPGSENDSFLLNDTVSDSASPFDWANRYAGYESLLKSIDGNTAAAGVQIMATEFNSNWGTEGKQMTSIVNGLFVADSIGSLMNSGYDAGLFWDLRNGWTTDGNNSPTLYGWRQGGDEGMLGDPNITNDAPSTGANVPYPTYFAEQLASKIVQSGGEVVSTVSNYSEMASYSVLEPNGHLDLLVINKNPDADISEQFNLSNFNASGQAQIWRYGEAEDYAQSLTTDGSAALTHLSTTVAINSGSFSYTFPAYSMTVIDLGQAPTLASAAAATPAPVTGTTTVLSAAATENGSSAGLTYTWATTASPNGAPAPQFSANASAAAATTTATFYAAGNYTFTVTITDASNASITSAVNVMVEQAPTTVTVSPSTGGTLTIGSTQQFTASVLDQFGTAIASPAVTWSATGGTINSAGLFTAGQSAGSFSVTATAGNAANTATGTVALPSWLGSGSIATWNPATAVLTVTGPASIIGDPGSSEPIVEASGASAVLTLDPSSGTDIHLGGLSLTGGASAIVTSLGASRSLTNYHLLVIGTPGAAAAPLYTIDSSSTLDLADNDMAILYGTGSSPLLTVQSELAESYDNAAWDKPGLTSSIAKTKSSSMGLGYAEASTLGVTTFDGLALGGNAVLVKYTLLGDTTLSGSVGLGDLDTVVGNFNGGSLWTQGDFHYGGSVGLGDLDDVEGNFNANAFSAVAADAVATSQVASESGTSTAVSTSTTSAPAKSPPVRSIPSRSTSAKSNTGKRRATVVIPVAGRQTPSSRPINERHLW